MTRHEMQQLFIRVCRDSGFRLEASAAANIAARAAGCSPLEFWTAIGTLDTMDAIARGQHPACHASRETAWLIERKDGGEFKQPHWYVEDIVPGKHGWTTDAATARRFGSRAEAEAFPAYRLIASDPAISITEHVFICRDATSVCLAA